MSETEGAVSGPDSERETLTEMAYRQIEERIVTLKLLPGEVLSEARLVSTLGIGRTPIREALQRLSREGLVVIMPRRGVVVSEINVKKQLELLLVRRELERLMARLAARRATVEEREDFARIAADMRQSAEVNDPVMFMRLDGELNQILSDTCRNAYAQGAMSLMQGLSRRFWYVHYKQVLDLPRCASLHAGLADAVAAGDEEAAALASDRLIDYLETFTRASLDAPPQISGAKISPN